MSKEVDETVVGLASAIEALRTELAEAQISGAGKSISFGIGKVEVEFGVETRTTGSGGAGVKFWVINADAKVDRSAAATHKVKVELLPTGSDGQPLKVAGGAAAPPSE